MRPKCETSANIGQRLQTTTFGDQTMRYGWKFWKKSVTGPRVIITIINKAKN